MSQFPNRSWTWLFQDITLHLHTLLSGAETNENGKQSNSPGRSCWLSRQGPQEGSWWFGQAGAEAPQRFTASWRPDGGPSFSHGIHTKQLGKLSPLSFSSATLKRFDLITQGKSFFFSFLVSPSPFLSFKIFFNFSFVPSFFPSHPSSLFLSLSYFFLLSNFHSKVRLEECLKRNKSYLQSWRTFFFLLAKDLFAVERTGEINGPKASFFFRQNVHGKYWKGWTS